MIKELFTKEYNFTSLEELVCDIVENFDDGNKDVDFVLTADEVQDFLTAFLSTGKFKPASIEWAISGISEYDKEYYFSLCRYGINEIIVLPVYRENRFMNTSDDSIILVSASVKVSTYNKFVKDYNNVILFDIEY